VRALIVSSFVLPHVGGVEQFVETAREVLRRSGWDVRVLACRLPGGETRADITVPTRFLRATEWPLPTGGWRELWSAVGQSDVVLVNGTRQLLPILAVACACARRRRCIVVLHGGETLAGDSFLYHRVLGSMFDLLLARPALRVSIPVAVSRSGVVGAQRTYGIEPRTIPFPLRSLPSAGTPPPLAPGEPLRVAWIGRFFPEKDPLTAVDAVERLLDMREATLDVYGTGVLRAELEERARTRPWLTLHGSLAWDEVLQIQSRTHVCLSSSSRDAVQVAVLEALCRGVPVVSTRVGDAADYYIDPELRRFCVEARRPGLLADALHELAATYEETRRAFARNGETLTERHTTRASAALLELVSE
jgi:glycosyltransferase involved in cell wall biosynthesis